MIDIRLTLFSFRNGCPSDMIDSKTTKNVQMVQWERERERSLPRVLFFAIFLELYELGTAEHLQEQSVGMERVFVREYDLILLSLCKSPKRNVVVVDTTVINI
jgi:hypothetical protein